MEPSSSSISYTGTLKGSGSFTDSRDGQVYKYTTIGQQTWMAENLNYKLANERTGANEASFSLYGTSVCNSAIVSGESSHCEVYGRFYDWASAMNTPYSGYHGSLIPAKHQGICPDGWHIPTLAEWEMLGEAVGGLALAGSKLKGNPEDSDYGWKDFGSALENPYGFSALPGGSEYNGSEWISIQESGHWWSATETSTGFNAHQVVMKYNSDSLFLDSKTNQSEPELWAPDKGNVFSVRCVQD
jgi:uncharacterized protein (TIGR02145 family)